MGKTDAEKELAKIIKIRTKSSKKQETNPCVYIKIRVAKDTIDLNIKDVSPGITSIRLHSTNKNFPKKYLHGYLINISNLKLDKKKIKNKKLVLDVLRNPSKVTDKPTRILLEKLDKDYGGIIPFGSKNLYYQTEWFKKKKDPYKVKMKTLN